MKLNPVEIFHKDWQSDAQIACVCEKVFLYIQSQIIATLNHYTFGLLQEKSQSSSEQLIKAITYLCSPKWNILKQVFIFVDEFSEEYYEFNDEEVIDYITNGYFIHPQLGLPIENKKDIYIVYEIGSYFGEDGVR
jgi:hypothetical protein